MPISIKSDSVIKGWLSIAGIPVVVILAACWLPCNHSWTSGPECSWSAGEQPILIAQRDQSNDDPHGPDPHGPNPHNEQHDSDLPANKADDARKAPTDPYGGAENREPAPARKEALKPVEQPL